MTGKDFALAKAYTQLDSLLDFIFVTGVTTDEDKTKLCECIRLHRDLEFRDEATLANGTPTTGGQFGKYHALTTIADMLEP
jgi:hypothetical protein